MIAILAVVLVSLLAGQAPTELSPRLNVNSPDGSAAPPGDRAQPSLDLHRLDAIEPLVRSAIAEKKLPGAVVLVGRGDRILYQKAIGNRALTPATEAMTIDTMFDLA